MDPMTPLPGDPSGLLSKAGELSRAAAQIQLAIDQLRMLSNRDETVSEAIDAVRHDAKDVADNVTKAHVRYTGTATALQQYAPKLEAAQQRAQRAIAAYHTATGDVQSAQHRLTAAQTAYTPDDGSTPPNDLVRNALFASSPEGARSRHAVQEAQADVTAAQNEWWAAVSDMTEAAKTAASLIDTAMDDSKLNDGFWDTIGAGWDAFVAWSKEYLAPVLNVLQQIAAVVGQIAGILSLVFLVLGAFFPVLEGLAGFFAMVSLVANLVSFACTFFLALMGDRSWGDVIVTGVVALLSVAGATGATESLLGGLTSNLASKIGGSGVVAQLAEGAAGRAAIEAGEQGADFATQAVVANVVQQSVVNSASEGLAKGIVEVGLDTFGDNVSENAAGLLDGATGQEDAPGWGNPPSILPVINFTGPDGPELAGGLSGADWAETVQGWTSGAAFSVPVATAHTGGGE
jgi:hypothetical protein